MKTTKSIVAIALSSIALISGAVSANPERDTIDQTLGTTAAARGNVMSDSNLPADGWQDVGGEHGATFVGRVSISGGDAHAYSKEEVMQARIDYRNAP